MKRFLTIAVVGVMALGLSSVAYANYCSTDVVPAATLLFPFVSYDYENGYEGQTTQFAITNVSSEAQIVHITVWTDYSVAILDFNIVLTGYDVARLNIRDILGLGRLPTDDEDTGRYDNIWLQYLDDEDPYFGYNGGGTPFDDGPYSKHNELLPGAPGYTNLPRPQMAGDTTSYTMLCNPATYIASPARYVDPIPQDTLDVFEGYLKASQTSARSYVDCSDDLFEFLNDPWFITREDGPVWMYITADVVNTCNKDLPDATPETYFAASRLTGVTDDNVLIGDVIWLNQTDRYSEADNAVHLESDPAFTGAVTFYERYVGAVTTTAAADYREPLPTAWAFRYQINDDSEINTWVRAFKASTNSRTVMDLASVRLVDPATGDVFINWGNIKSAGPATLYASSCIAYTYWAWDEQENVNSVTSDEDPWSGTDTPIRPVPNLLPLETQEVEASQFYLVSSDIGEFGWMLFAWPGTNGSTSDRYQTWMGVKYSGFGDYTAALSGAVMANYNCNTNEIIPVFNLGEYTTWNVPAGPPTE